MMKKFGEITTKRPLVTILTILIITGLMASAYLGVGMTSRMDESDFTPDMKEAKVDREISETFTSTYSVSLFVRSADGKSNIITPENMSAVIAIENAIYNDPEIKQYLATGNPGDVTSVADLIAQMEILGALYTAIEEQTREMFAFVNQTINYTVKQYAQQGISPAEGEYIKQALLMSLQARYPSIEENATHIATAMYSQRESNITTNATMAVNGVLTQTFDMINSTLNASSLSGMDNASARDFINQTVESAMSSAVENATYYALGSISMDLVPIINATLGYEVQMLSMEMGMSLGYTYGAYIQNKTASLVQDIVSAIERFTGYDMNTTEFAQQGGENETGSQDGMSGMSPDMAAMMAYINSTVENATTMFATQLAQDLANAVNDTMNTTMLLFSSSLSTNISAAVYPITVGLEDDIYANRTDDTNISMTINRYLGEATAAVDPLVGNSIDATVSPTVQGGFNINLSALVPGTVDTTWPAILNLLNATYTTIIGSMADSLRQSFSDAMSRMLSGGSGMGAASGSFEDLLSLFSNLSYPDKMSVFDGGTVNVSLGGREFSLSFERMNQSRLEEMIRDVYENPRAEMSFFTEAMNMSFTHEFNPPEKIEAVGMLVGITLTPTLHDDDDLATRVEKLISNRVENASAAYTDLKVTTLGVYTISDEIMDYSMKSMHIIMPLAILMVIIILAIIYRNLFDVLISLSGLFFAIIWVYGFGTLVGYVFNPLLIVVPVLIVGLGIDFGIHITMRYRREMEEEGLDVQPAMVRTISTVGTALLLATFTTIVAFLSNASSPIPALGQFGILCAFGIVSSFIIMITFVPSAKIIRDRRRLARGKPLYRGFRAKGTNNNSGPKSGDRPNNTSADKNPPEASGDTSGDKKQKKAGIKDVGVKALDRFLSLGAVGSERHPAIVLAIAVVLTGAGFYAVTMVPTTFDFRDFLPEEVPLAKELNFMLDEYDVESLMGDNVNILVKGDVATRDCVLAAQESMDDMGDDPHVVVDNGKADTTSVLSLMEDYATYTPGGNDYRYDPYFSVLYYSVFDQNGSIRASATDEDIKTLFDWLYTNATDDARKVIHQDESGNYDSMLIKVSVDVGDNREEIYKLRDALEKDVEPLKQTDGVDEVVVTSGPILTQLILDAINHSQIRSLLITFVASLVAMAIVYYITERSFVLGIITTLPMIFCVGWLFGAMYLLGISLNVLTISIAALTVGIGITYGIHVAHSFAEEIKKDGDVEMAVRRTVAHVGTAVFGAATTTIGGFGLLVFALLPPIQQFGGMTALSVFFSFLSSVFVLPSILVLWARRSRCCFAEEKKEKKGETGEDRDGKTAETAEAPETQETPEVGVDDGKEGDNNPPGA